MMRRFSYKAVTPDGKVLQGEIEAATREAVIDRLRGQGAIPIRADECQRRERRKLVLPRLFTKTSVTPRDITHLTRELAILLEAGLPLDRSLSTLGSLASPAPIKSLVDTLLTQVRGGATLADAVEGQGTVFPGFYAGMVRAGEAGGSLEKVLNRLADTLEYNQTLQDDIRAALTYPILVVILTVVSLTVLMTLVIPEFRPLFDEAGTELPLSTKVIIAVSDFMLVWGWAIPLGFLAFVLALRQHNRTRLGRERWDRWMLGLPLLGDLIVKIETVRFTRTLGTLLSNGVTLLNALDMACGTLGNQALATAVANVRGSLAEGAGLSGPMGEIGLFPQLALQLIQVGEESGQLEQMLLRVANIYDGEVKRSIQNILALLVPAITIALGILIAAIIGSMMSAILSAYDLPF
jgi:general secretion pathway protein F